MVKIIILISSIFVSLECLSQKMTITENEVEFNVCFANDSVNFNDSVKVQLIYRNKTDHDIKLYFPTYSHIFSTAIGHTFKGYFTLDDALYNLKNYPDSDTIKIIKPDEIFVKKYNVIIEKRFFKMGENNLYVFHRVWAYPMITNKRGVKRQRPLISLVSSSLYLHVNNR